MRAGRNRAEYLHLGERDLADLRMQHLASQRSDGDPYGPRGTTLGVTAPVIGGGISLGRTAPGSPAVSAYDDALRAETWLGSSVLQLADLPHVDRVFRIQYLRGSAQFVVGHAPGDPSLGTVHQIYYAARIEGMLDGRVARGILFLMGWLGHSRWRGQTPQTGDFAPSTLTGLRYAFHVRRGAPAETFNPVAGYDLRPTELAHLAEEVLVLTASAETDPAYTAEAIFLARIHGAFFATDVVKQHFPAAISATDYDFCLFGAPLWIRERHEGGSRA